MTGQAPFKAQASPEALIRELEQAIALAYEHHEDSFLIHSLENALGLAHTFDLTPDLTLAREIVHTLALAFTLNVALVPHLDRIREIARALEHACAMPDHPPTPKFDIKSEITRLRDYGHDLLNPDTARILKHARILDDKRTHDRDREHYRSLARFRNFAQLRKLTEPEMASAPPMQNEVDPGIPPARPNTVSKAFLDVAVPEQVQLQRAFDVAAAVRVTDSSFLNDGDLPRVESGDARLFWPASEDYVRLRLEIKAHECQILDDDHYTFLLPRGENSPVFYFHLIPQKTGDLSVTVTLYQENDHLGSSRVKTTAVAQVAGEVPVIVNVQETDVNFSDDAIHKAHTPPGLSPALSNRLRHALSQSTHFAGNAVLNALFVDARISAWRNLIPDNAENRAARVNGLIHTLYDKTNMAGDNALVLFLHVLAEHIGADDASHTALRELATELARHTAKLTN